MSTTKNPYLNILIALLILGTLCLLCKPCYITENDSASVMSYICMNTRHDGVTDYLTSIRSDFVLNGQVWTPILLFILGIAALFFMITKRNTTASLYLPMVFSVVGIITVWTNELTRIGGVTVWPTILMLAAFILCLMNGNFITRNGDEVWRDDPQAKRKLKEIDKAVAKKKLELLQAHAQSTDVSVRTAAIEGMAKVGGNAAFQPLIAQLSCSNPDIRIAAAQALSELGDQRGRSFLLHYMQSDHDSRVRAAMRAALSKLPSQGE